MNVAHFAISIGVITGTAYFLQLPISAQDSQPAQGQAPHPLIRKSSGALVESATSRPVPAYPSAALTAGVSGNVVVELLIDRQGSVAKSRVISGHPALRDVSEDAARRWKFNPTLVGGARVLVMGTIVFSFKDGQVSAGPLGSPGSIAISRDSTVPVFSKKELRDLRRELARAHEIPIYADNAVDAQLVVTESRIKTARRDEAAAGLQAGTMINDHVMQAYISVLNLSDNTIDRFDLQFVNATTGNWFLVHSGKLLLASRATHEIKVDLMAVTGDPAHLQVGAVRSGPVKDLGEGRRPRFSRQLPAADPHPDTRARPLNRPRPLYTGLARKNRVTGTVTLRLEVRTDGSVGEIEVINSLPDGLTEQAIRSVRELKFQPAMKAGFPVPTSISLEVDFNLE